MTSTGKGQKLCKLLKRTLPASNIFWIPGISEMRMPWPSSIKLNPSLPSISRSIASPAVWRPEFQHVEKEIIGVDERLRHCREFWLGRGRDRAIAYVTSGHAQNCKGENSINHRRDGEGGPHADQIGKSGDDETSDRH